MKQFLFLAIMSFGINFAAGQCPPPNGILLSPKPYCQPWQYVTSSTVGMGHYPASLYAGDYVIAQPVDSSGNKGIAKCYYINSVGDAEIPFSDGILISTPGGSGYTFYHRIYDSATNKFVSGGRNLTYTVYP